MQSQQLETLGLMASTIAHDFNNLLASIIGQSSLALMKLPPHDHARQHIEKIIQSAEFATALSQQVLDFTSSDPVEPELVHLNSLIEETIELLKISLLNNVNIKTDLDNDLSPVYLKKTPIRQAFINLLKNSVDAMQQTEAIIHIKTGKQFVESAEILRPFLRNPLPAPGNYITLQIQDFGVGMEETVLKHIFDPFYTTKTKGRGLGLANILDIITTHEGGITVQSKPGVGSTFTLFFPVHRQKRSFYD